MITNLFHPCLEDRLASLGLPPPDELSVYGTAGSVLRWYGDTVKEIHGGQYIFVNLVKGKLLWWRYVDFPNHGHHAIYHFTDVSRVRATLERWGRL